MGFLWCSGPEDSGVVLILTSGSSAMIPLLSHGASGYEGNVIKFSALRNPFVYRKPMYFA